MGLSILFLCIGMGILVLGASLLVTGASGIARKLKIPSMIIGLTIVSIGTSIPELSVNIVSSIKGYNDFALGNILGSNIFNVLMVLGCSSIVIPIVCKRDVVENDLGIHVVVTFFLGLCMFVITKGRLSRIEGILFLILAIGYTIYLFYVAKKKNNRVEEEEKNIFLSILFFLLGLAGIIYGSQLVVDHSVILAKAFGMSDMLISLTILSIGTSLPEFATTMAAAIQKDSGIAIGNIVGSGIYNILLILGLSATIAPLSIDMGSFIDFAVLFFSAILLFFLSKRGSLGRASGILMVTIYLAYMVYIFYRNYAF